ncbi:ribosomal protein L7/L12 [Kitasatospora sp. NPDC088391]|uniref:ribosomal protein L7/L12 n=1 Tax=Kitasatospora sp. NPDC088391 TaxID=3364074 RepID=UPI0038308F0C
MDESEGIRYAVLLCDHTDHDVLLLDPGPAPFEVVKVHRALTGVGILAARQAVTGPLPVPVLTGIEERAAHRHAARLRAAGATVEVRPHA